MKRLSQIMAIYSIIIAIGVIAIWSMLLATQQISEGKLEMGFHLFAEFTMAVICLVSGIMLLKNKPLAREANLVGQAMIVYSVINAAGYYGQLGNTGMMVLFVGIGLMSLLVIYGHYYVASRMVE